MNIINTTSYIEDASIEIQGIIHGLDKNCFF